MNCVNCREPMVVLELDQVEIDHCLDCGGIWLDAGELELLLENSAEVAQLLARPLTTGTVKPTKRKCPICLKAMEEILAAEDSSTFIDRCRQGHGLWFDKGELRELLRILSADSSNKVVRLLEELFPAAPKGKEK